MRGKKREGEGICEYRDGMLGAGQTKNPALCESSFLDVFNRSPSDPMPLFSFLRPQQQVPEFSF